MMRSVAQQPVRSSRATRLWMGVVVAAAVVVLAPVGALAAAAWTIVPSPNSGTDFNELFGVACVTNSDCWAAGGHSASGGANQTLFERWNGSTWNIVASPPNVSTGDNDLYGVTCASASECWAVGGYSPNTSGTGFQTLIERWDGTSWTTAPSTNASSGDNVLEGVTCSSATDCWAVGYYTNGSTVLQTLIERWDGTSWATVASPNVGSGQVNSLHGVSCTLATDCWTVGYFSNGSTDQTLSEHWNGAVWTVVATPNSGASANLLDSVACVSSTECWAAGFFDSGTAFQTLIEDWNGSVWTITPSPNTGSSQNNSLNGVTCASAAECWASGSFKSGTSDQTLIEGWDGTAWTIATSPNTETDDVLLAVTCTAGAECWSTGFSYDTPNAGPDHTLIEELAPPPSPQVPDVPWAALIPVAGLVAVASRRLLPRGKQS